MDLASPCGFSCEVPRLSCCSLYIACVLRLCSGHDGGVASHSELDLQVCPRLLLLLLLLLIIIIIIIIIIIFIIIGLPFANHIRQSHPFRVVHSHEAKKQEFVILILLLLFISAWTTDVSPLLIFHNWYWKKAHSEWLGR